MRDESLYVWFSPVYTKLPFLYSSYRKIMPLGLSGGDHVNIIAREDRTVTNGAGCSDGAEIQAYTRVNVTLCRNFYKGSIDEVKFCG